MAEFKNTTALQKYQLQILTEAVRTYVKLIELPSGCRHRKCVLTFTGDRFKATDIKINFVRPKAHE